MRAFAAILALLAFGSLDRASAQESWTAPLDGVQRLKRDPMSQIPAMPAPATVRPGFTFAAAGDLLGPGRPITPLKDPGFEQVAALIRGADAALGNGEGNAFDLSSFKGYPAAQNGGGNRLNAPEVAADYKAMGFDFISKPNNHAVDWGLEGLAETTRVLKEAGLVTVGAGRNRAAARAPAFMETPHGRVAVVAAASTFVPWSMAGDPEGEAPGRPGISVIRTRKIALLSPDDFAAIRSAAAHQPGARVAADARQVTLFGQAYRAAPRAGVTYEMNDLDQYEVLKAVRAAKQQSDFTVFTIHAHEDAGTGDDSVPGDFLPLLAHHVIDAGADMVLMHGPHGMRGVEVYRGKPIFYGLGSFFFQMELGAGVYGDGFEALSLDPKPLTYLDYIRLTRFNLPAEWFESVLAVAEFDGNHMKAVRFYPLDLGHAGRADNLRGAPRPASAEAARKILTRLAAFSAPYGTRMTIEDGVGIVRLTP